MALGSVAKQPLIDSTGHMKILHSLESLSFLKIDPCNYMSFRC